MSIRVSSRLQVIAHCLASITFAAAVQARPIVVEELSSFETPDPAYTSFAASLAIDGVNALVVATRPLPNPDNPTRPRRGQTAFLFHLNGTTWTLVRRLNEYDVHPDFQFPVGVALRGGIAAAQIGRMDIWELGKTNAGTTGWVRRASLPADENPGSAIEIDGTRILNGQGSCEWSGQIYEKNSAGNWVVGQTLTGYRRADGCDDSFHGESVSIAGPWAIVHQRKPENQTTPSTLIFQHADGSWFTYGEARPEADVTTFGPETELLGDDVLVGGSDVTGTLVYREQPQMGYHLADRIRTVDGYMGAGHSLGFARDGDLLLQRSNNADRDACVVHVFKRGDDGAYAHVATLVGRNGQSLTGAIAVSGRRVLVSDDSGLVHFFEVPAKLAAPEPRQDTFSTGAVTALRPTAGSAFAAVDTSGSRVLRQTQTQTYARAVYGDIDWTNEAIETDVRIRNFAMSGAGVGVATRFQADDTNYFEALMCSTGRLVLRRRASGTLRTLASTALKPVLNRTYRLRLESIGTQHRVFVDGALMLDVDAGGATHGHPVLFTNHAAADFDNVMITPSPLTTIYSTDFESDQAGPWTTTGAGFWNLWRGDSQLWFQSSIAGDARASIGVPTDDQVVRVRARLDTFATATGSEERWFGLMARAADARNYYYLSLRSSNTLSLRKLVDGVATTLASTSFTVAPATWYDLRLEAVGNQIRAYVDGTLRLEATDDSHARGASGPVMYKTAADYDDFVAYQP